YTIVWVQLKRFVKLLNGLIISTTMHVDPSYECVDDAGERFQTEGSMNFRVGLLVTSHQSEIETVLLMCGSMPRIELNGPLEFLHSRHEIVVINSGISQRTVGFGQARVHFDCSLCQLPSFDAALTRRHKPPGGKSGQAIGQT